MTTISPYLPLIMQCYTAKVLPSDNGGLNIMIWWDWDRLERLLQAQEN